MLKLETIEDIVNFAIAREQYACELYKSMAKREVYSNVARLCEQLAAEELKHKQKLQQDFLMTGQAVSPMELSEYVVHNEQKTIFMDCQEFLAFAVKKEEKSIKFYKKMAEATTKVQYKNVFLDLAAEEEKHKEFLQKKLEDLLK